MGCSPTRHAASPLLGDRAMGRTVRASPPRLPRSARVNPAARENPSPRFDELLSAQRTPGLLTPWGTRVHAHPSSLANPPRLASPSPALQNARRLLGEGGETASFICQQVSCTACGQPLFPDE
jgi:hypothetical protein